MARGACIRVDRSALERERIENEYQELQKRIGELEGLLGDDAQIHAVIKEETADLRKTYGQDRRTEIIAKTEEISIEDMIAEEDMVITVSHTGYIKRSPVSLRTRQIASYIGLSMIIVLMVMVFKNDIQRNWDSVIALFQ